MAKNSQVVTNPAQLQALQKAIPNPYDKGVYYPAIYALNGNPVKVRKTYSRGIPYLKIRIPFIGNVKNSSGEIEGKYEGEYVYTFNLRTNVLTFQSKDFIKFL